MCILLLLTSRRVSQGTEARKALGQIGAKSTEEGKAIDET